MKAIALVDQTGVTLVSIHFPVGSKPTCYTHPKVQNH